MWLVAWILSCLLAFVQHLLHSVAFCSSTVVVTALGLLEHLASIRNVGVINTQTPKSDRHLISPNIITPESNIKDTRIKKSDHQLKNLLIVKLVLFINLISTLGDIIENSMKNMHADVRV